MCERMPWQCDIKSPPPRAHIRLPTRHIVGRLANTALQHQHQRLHGLMGSRGTFIRYQIATTSSSHLNPNSPHRPATRKHRPPTSITNQPTRTSAHFSKTCASSKPKAIACTITECPLPWPRALTRIPCRLIFQRLANTASQTLPDCLANTACLLAR